MTAELQRITAYDGVLDGFSQRVRAARAGICGEFDCNISLIGRRTGLKALEQERYGVAVEGEKIIIKFHGQAFGVDTNAWPILNEI